VPVISIVALVMTLNARDRVRRLERRITALEATHAGPPSVAQTAEPAPAAPHKPPSRRRSLSSPWPLPKFWSRSHPQWLRRRQLGQRWRNDSARNGSSGSAALRSRSAPFFLSAIPSRWDCLVP